MFATFPWPNTRNRRRAGGRGRRVRRLLDRRSEICLAEDIGLTKLYNADWTTVRGPYLGTSTGSWMWPSPIAMAGLPAAQDDREIVRRLTELNQGDHRGGGSTRRFS